MESRMGNRKLAGTDDLGKIRKWNKNVSELADGLCIHQQFERQARETPERIAVSFADQTITYSQLEERANQLAHYLISCGVRPDTFVGICIERSINMIIGILGILKAGGAYIPLDPEYPPQRLAYMVEDSGALVLLTTKKMISRLPETDKKTICIDDQYDEIRRQPSQPPHSGVLPDNLIYVIYTSGSTGKPKGTLIFHRGFVNLIHWYTTEFDFGMDSRVLLMTSTSFDLTQKNIFAPLVNGGRLVVLESDFFDPLIIRTTIGREGVTSINCTPSAFHGLLQDADDECFEKLATLKQVFLGGEPIVPSKLKAWRSNPHYSAQVINSYGPTECTDVCAFYRLVDYDRYEKSSVPIGRPICNTRLYIVDEELRMLAIGEEGELCIGGAGVGAGYLNRDDLTRERFVHAAFNSEESGRIYRTGDLVRYLGDGNIEYIGRIDQQVKIRGFRIELGEIEAQLETHEAIREVVVHAHESAAGDKRLAAYIVREPGQEASINDLRAYLQNTLPDYMLPTAWVFIDAIPLTPNGKIDRNALPAPTMTRPEITQQYVAPKDGIESAFAQIWQELLGFDKIGVNDPFFEMGGTSIQAIQFISRAGFILKTAIPIVHFFDSPTISKFVDYLKRNHGASVRAVFSDGSDELADLSAEEYAIDRTLGADNSKPLLFPELSDLQDDIAIIGMAGKFPGADNKDELWENLLNGIQAISKVTREDLKASGIDPSVMDDAAYVPVCYPLNDYDKFDAGFFGYTPKEAELLDPQQRFFLERAWEVLEDGGYDLQQCNAKVGIFGSVARNGYLVHNIASHKKLRDESGDYQSLMANEKDFPATRAAYKLGLTGPAVNIQTACSSSGVALHLACQSLRSGDCDMAIVGGCRVMVPHRTGYKYVEGSAFSADGSIRAFDAGASGMVRGSGGGCILIKRLKNAVSDGDHIYAVIKSTAVNNDGSDKIGFTAPSIQGQAEVITKAIAMAGIAPETVHYIETHGTGTNLGDPIEFTALSQAYRRYTQNTGFCFIGSVKANIGHLDAGACVTGVIKASLAVKNKIIPPQINYERPNSAIQFENSPFKINTKPLPWKENGEPRRAGISSFGLGGSNAHLIIEEAPEELPSAPTLPRYLFKLSARSQQGLETYKLRFLKYLKQNRSVNIADVCHTSMVGRRGFEWRYYTTCQSVEDLTAQLETGGGDQSIDPEILGGRSSTTFMFPGQGAQHIDMGRDLYDHNLNFRQIVDECSAKLMSDIGCDLREIIYPAHGGNDEATARLTQTRYAQPALFVMEYAMAKLYQTWGIAPDFLIGHSIGEITAACLSGVFSLDDALSTVAMRARLMQNAPTGSMLSIGLSESELESIGLDHTAIAAVNTQDRCVVSGPSDRIGMLKDKLERMGIGTRPVPTSHAFHSEMMNLVCGPFEEFLRTIQLRKPRIPIVSCMTGQVLEGEQATDPAYWAQQLRQPVRFSDGLSVILNDHHCILLEVGPGNTLSTFAKQIRTNGNSPAIVSSWGHAKSGKSSLGGSLSAVGKLWLGNADINWSAISRDAPGKRIPLPTYPFDVKRYWIAPYIEKDVAGALNLGELSDKENDMDKSPQDRADALVDATTGSNDTEHHQRIRNELRSLVMEYTGFGPDEIDDSLSFLELGLDSIYMTQIAGAIKKKFDLEIQLRELFEDLTSIDLLADFLSREVPAGGSDDALPAIDNYQASDSRMSEDMAMGVSTIEKSKEVIESALVGPGGSDGVQEIVFSQLRIMERQLEALAGRDTRHISSHVSGMRGNGAPALQAQADTGRSTAQNTKRISTEASGEKSKKPVEKPFGAGVRIHKTVSNSFTAKQKDFIKTFGDTYLAATKRSKDYTEKHRGHLADPRSVSGFSLPLKEFVYPIVIDRSNGSRVWDIDGNEYIDMTNGFGANLLGHSPSYIQEAIAAQLNAGIEIGPQHPLAGEVAQMICEMTGFDRAIFCNTGSEAVMGAMRICRSVSGRDKIVMFTDDYHGMFDEVIVRGTKNLRSIPAASGIPFASVENVIVLEYGNPESLEIIAREAGEIAAVLVEPVQSRNLDLQPKTFLHELRQITEQHRIALIFDEVVTGFRSHIGGAQAYFGVSADIATYGKVVGGGMPIGVIAGKSRFMDALDGGHWNYGDQSIPEAGVTYFAGTFVRHPLALAAAKATLIHLKQCGPTLQENLNDRTLDCVTKIREYLKSIGAPIKILHFSSAFQFNYTSDVPFGGLIYPILRSKGIHIFEGRTWFFTTSHTEEDMNKVCSAFQESVFDMVAGGFIESDRLVAPQPTQAPSSADMNIPSQPPVPGARIGRCPDGNPAWFIKDPNRDGKFLRVG